MSNTGMIDRESIVFFSIGVLADHIINGSRRAMVIPIDKTPILPQNKAIIPSYMDRMKTPDSAFMHSGTSADGRSYSVPVTTDTAINAEFLNDDPNLVSVPMLRAGQTVELYRRQGTEDYFWKQTAMKQNLAERDHSVKTYAASGEGKQPTGQEDMGVHNQPNSSYIQTFSPANKEISIMTSKANGEPVGWHIQLNTKEGALTVLSTAGDLVQIDAVNKRITLKNSDDTIMDLNKKDIYIHAGGNLKFEIEGNVEWKVGGNLTENIQGNEEITMGGSSKSTYGSNVEINAPSHDTKAPQGSFTGQYQVGGVGVVGGGGGDGQVKSKGNMVSDADVIASGISLTKHTHRGDSGGSTSKPN